MTVLMSALATMELWGALLSMIAYPCFAESGGHDAPESPALHVLVDVGWAGMITGLANPTIAAHPVGTREYGYWSDRVWGFEIGAEIGRHFWPRVSLSLRGDYRVLSSDEYYRLLPGAVTLSNLAQFERSEAWTASVLGRYYPLQSKRLQGFVGTGFGWTQNSVDWNTFFFSPSGDPRTYEDGGPQVRLLVGGELLRSPFLVRAEFGVLQDWLDETTTSRGPFVQFGVGLTLPYMR